MVLYAKPAASACARSGAGRCSPTENPITSIGAGDRYGVEDTRRTVREVRRQSLDPFCIALDAEVGACLAHRLGGGGFAIIRRPSQSPARPHRRYARPTR